MFLIKLNRRILTNLRNTVLFQNKKLYVWYQHVWLQGNLFFQIKTKNILQVISTEIVS